MANNLPVLANAALLKAAPGLGDFNAYIRQVTNLIEANGVPVPHLTLLQEPSPSSIRSVKSESCLDENHESIDSVSGSDEYDFNHLSAPTEVNLANWSPPAPIMNAAHQTVSFVHGTIDSDDLDINHQSTTPKLSIQVQQAPQMLPANVQETTRIIEGYKAKQKLAIGQHLFNRERKVKEKIYWKYECFDDGCTSRVHTNEHGQVIKHPGVHNHPAVPGKAEVEQILADMKAQATSTNESINSIITYFSSKVHRDFKDLLPQRHAIANMLHRHRKKAGIDDIETYSNTHNGFIDGEC